MADASTTLLTIMRKISFHSLCFLLSFGCLSSLRAQEAAPADRLSGGPFPRGYPAELNAGALNGAVQPGTAAVEDGKVKRSWQDATHPFLDRENKLLFTAAGGWATADFFVTRANLASGGRELNPVAGMFTRSTPALAANFALETGGTIAIAYMFHRTGHHKLERWTSVAEIGGSAGAVAFGLIHR